MAEQEVLLSIDARGIGTITINRPQVYNAYNADLLEALGQAIEAFVDDKHVRIIQIRSNGKLFQAGADINWLKANSSNSLEVNRSISELTTNTFKTLNECSKPLVVLVQGGCFGGGVGIVAAADIVISEEGVEFAITEVRWGLVAGPILTQLVSAIGLQNTRRFSLTAELFDANRALEIGLIHHVCPVGGLDKAVLPVFELLLRAGPNALNATKQLIFDATGTSLDDKTAHWIINQNASQRQSSEASEGLASFVERRKPSWYPRGKENDQNY